MADKSKIRLDTLLVERGFFNTRTRAQAAILAGVVLVEDKPGVKAGDNVPHDCEIRIRESDCPYVSRGGLKLEGALEGFGLDPSGWDVLDVGASTGGFTDCLLKRGARHVTALDVGKGLIDWSLRSNPSVTVIEGVNARSLEPGLAMGPFDLVVMDVSFISIKLILPELPVRLKPGGMVLSLVKPQFEAGKGMTSKGVVRDPSIWKEVLTGFTVPGLFGPDARMVLKGFTASRISGKQGNREFFALWEQSDEAVERPDQSRIMLEIENLTMMSGSD